MSRPRAIGLAACLLATTSAQGVDTQTMDVTREGDTFRAKAVFRLDAPVAAVYAVITDFGALDRISPHILESRRLAGDGSETLVRVVTRSCLAFFCRDVTTVERLREQPPNTIRAEIVPERSDLASGQTRWHLSRERDATRLEWTTQFVPGFWVPPLLGTAAVRRALSQQLADGAAGINRLANERAAGPE
ncbi:SRPBCC family protein [Spectribacter hydrogenooxidans]|uniref:SRPBCC family protein n=1 Tax=Spectribacter hydrogenoxidans TaxID=3075608 RepID=A0ABU3BWE3_9GAMM|nr:SRPBCC family protein [Salinisphaera sp. W335]MDT0633618.1 SRPBCC family protein [Salinisphaera sp. W335]